MPKSETSLIKYNKYYIILLLVILILTLFTIGVKTYFSNTISTNWEQVSDEKTSDVSNKCLNVFYSYQKQAEEFSGKISNDKKFVSALISQNSKKMYDAIFEIESSENYSLEVYNSRFEMLVFNGRQLFPEALELKRAFEGSKFSIVREMGLFTFLIVFEPVKNEKGEVLGVVASGLIIDVNPDIHNAYFGDIGIKNEIYRAYNISVAFQFGPENNQDTIETAGYKSIVLTGIDGNPVGKIFIPPLDKNSYLNSIGIKFNNLLSFMLFTASVILLLWVGSQIQKIEFLFFKCILYLIVLFAARYFWLMIEFPSDFLADFNSESFSPNFYASGFGFGIAKSLGELIITSGVILVSSYILLKYSLKYYQKEQGDKKSIFVSAIIILFSIALIFILINCFGIVFQSIIYDSTIKFIDKTELFSLNQPELLIARLTLTFLSVSLLFLISALGLIIIKRINPYIAPIKNVRKYSTVLLAVILVAIVPLVHLVSDLPFSQGLIALILLNAGFIMLYLHRKISVDRNYKASNISFLSILLLSCTIFIPVIILTKITSQENHYLEKAAREISQKNDDRISFLVTSVINELVSDEDLESDIKNKNKIGNLAFKLWSTSGLNDEDVNSAVYVLDTGKRIISDFSIIPGDLNKDSIVKYVINSFRSKKLSDIEDEEEELSRDTSISESQTVSVLTEHIIDPRVIQNKDNKYYAAISEINPLIDDNKVKSPISGYIIVVCSYDSRNYFKQGNLGLLRISSREKTNKFTSTPVFSEFSDGELAGSSNIDVSKALIKSLQAFKESVKDKPVKAALRYDQFENESYKSYYILSESHENTPEKIYVVSIKTNNFALSSFFYFRYLLFSVSVYLIILLVFILYRLIMVLFKWRRTSEIKFGFREKLFASFLIASVVPIIILALYTRGYVTTKNEESYNNQLISDLRLVEQYVKNRLQLNVKIEKDSKKENILSFSDVFDKELAESNKNFNLYFKNRITATTSEQLYKSDLLDTRISGNAFYNIALLKKDFYTENQQIGDFTFIVGYKPVFDRYNYLTGIISTQTVFKQNEINQELTESLIYIFGPYVSAVIILIFIVNVLSYRISNPILKLQKATEKLSRGLVDVEVRSNSKDEIGELVKSFNRMVKELKRAQEELKMAERETAWRDIARQVAHEIKNPLTPMMLAMQHLYKSYTSGSKNFEKIIKSTNKMIIEQIETLNKIATEFSNFARLPGKNYEMLDPDEILRDVAALMNTKQNIELKISKQRPRKVRGDRDELKRAILNIVKNSVQAVEENADKKTAGKVTISTDQTDGYYHVIIKDNGMGMDKYTLGKLFEPYFSTKSSGMGLGLVITKKILDDMKARIRVKSDIGKGTEVEIIFKVN